MFEILHFRDSDKIIRQKNMENDVKETLQYIDDVLAGVQFKKELLRQALDDMGWREIGTLNILKGRRYMYKGIKKNVAIDGNFSAYEYIMEGLMRLQHRLAPQHQRSLQEIPGDWDYLLLWFLHLLLHR